MFAKVKEEPVTDVRVLVKSHKTPHISLRYRNLTVDLDLFWLDSVKSLKWP